MYTLKNLNKLEFRSGQLLRLNVYFIFVGNGRSYYYLVIIIKLPAIMSKLHLYILEKHFNKTKSINK